MYDLVEEYSAWNNETKTKNKDDRKSVRGCVPQWLPKNIVNSKERIPAA